MRKRTCAQNGWRRSGDKWEKGHKSVVVSIECETRCNCFCCGWCGSFPKSHVSFPCFAAGKLGGWKMLSDPSLQHVPPTLLASISRSTSIPSISHLSECRAHSSTTRRMSTQIIARISAKTSCEPGGNPDEEGAYHSRACSSASRFQHARFGTRWPPARPGISEDVLSAVASSLILSLLHLRRSSSITRYRHSLFTQHYSQTALHHRKASEASNMPSSDAGSDDGEVRRDRFNSGLSPCVCWVLIVRVCSLARTLSILINCRRMVSGALPEHQDEVVDAQLQASTRRKSAS